VHCGTTMVQEVVCAGLGVGDVAGPVGIGNGPLLPKLRRAAR
jgi:hypothetical protein